MSEAAGVSRRAPLWFAPALVALVGWLGGVHQPGPLSVFPEVRTLPLAWYAIEQAVAVAVTMAALGAGAAVLSGRVPPLRVTLSAVCEARYALALAAALASRVVADSFLPAQPVTAGDGGVKLALGVGQWLWLAVMAAAVAGLTLRAAARYLLPLRLVIADGPRLAAAFVVAMVLGEVTGRTAAGLLIDWLMWPPA